MGKSGEKQRTRDLEKTRQNILAAGRAEFAEHGLQGARVDRIAKKAGANKYMIYYIFGGKDELYLAALESLWETKYAAIDAPLASGDITVDDLGNLVAQAMETFYLNRDAARMVLHDLVSGAKYIRQLKEKRPELFETFDVVTQLLRYLSESGVIRPVNPQKAIFTVAMIVLSFSVLQPHFDIFVDRDSELYKDISDLESWGKFVGDVVKRVLLP